MVRKWIYARVLLGKETDWDQGLTLSFPHFGPVYRPEQNSAGFGYDSAQLVHRQGRIRTAENKLERHRNC